MSEPRQLLVDTWEARNQLYQDLFGAYTAVTPASYGPPKLLGGEAERGSDPGGSGDPGLAEDTLAILTYAPDPLRPYWTYVTAGLSTPWYQEEPLEVSAFGCEMVIKSPTEASWPLQILRTIAFHVLNHAGTLSPGVRIALNGPVSVNTDSDLTGLFVWYTDEAPDAWYQLPSGGFGLFTAIGITDDELTFAESIEDYGTWCISEVLRRTGIGQVTDPARKSALKGEAVQPLLQSLRAYAENFRGTVPQEREADF